MEKATLIVELADRDQNILVLRRLLEEKTRHTQPQAGQKPPSRPPLPAPDYSSMPLERLRQFDKARDSTVAFLLKKIDEAEKQNNPRSISPDPVSPQPSKDESTKKDPEIAAEKIVGSLEQPASKYEESSGIGTTAGNNSVSESKPAKLAPLKPFEEESSDDTDDGGD